MPNKLNLPTKQIKKMRADGMAYRDIAAVFGCSYSAIQQIFAPRKPRERTEITARRVRLRPELLTERVETITASSPITGEPVTQQVRVRRYSPGEAIGNKFWGSMVHVNGSQIPAHEGEER